MIEIIQDIERLVLMNVPWVGFDKQLKNPSLIDISQVYVYFIFLTTKMNQ